VALIRTDVSEDRISHRCGNLKSYSRPRFIKSCGNLTLSTVFFTVVTIFSEYITYII
jgi:hypothetical protein